MATEVIQRDEWSSYVALSRLLNENVGSPSRIALMDIAIVPATRADTLVLDRLLQLSAYDFSEYGGTDVDSNGVFLSPYSDTIWQPHDHNFLIRVDGQLAGFAFVTRRDSYIEHGDVYLLSEFFMMRKYRRRGVGKHVACTIFDRFPGRWELATNPGRIAAQAFWRRVVGDYAEGT